MPVTEIPTSAARRMTRQTRPSRVRANGQLGGHDAAQQVAQDGEEAEHPDEPSGQGAAAQ
jgi:hypothetical protein